MGLPKIRPHAAIKCDICKRMCELDYVDGATRFGPWANMCLACHRIHGVGLGLGRGQRYAKRNHEILPDETPRYVWQKAEG